MSKVGADDFIHDRQATAEDLNGLPRVDLWPTLAPEALYGLAGHIVSTIDPYTEADPVATLANVLTGVGNIIGARPHARVQHDQHPLRLNVALVGRTAKGRKGTSWSTPRYLLTQVDSDWASRRIMSGLSSGEGLIHTVRDPVEREIKDRETGETRVEVVDEGEPDKRLLIIEPELAVTLKSMARETNTLSGMIRQAWDSGDLSTLTRKSPLRATGAHISIIGHITQDELQRYLTETERANGFANRFLWMLVRRSKMLPEGGAVPEENLVPLVAELKRVVAFARETDELRRDDLTRQLWADVYPDLSEGKPGMAGAIISRAEAQVLRLSALYAILDCSPIVQPVHLHAALAVWDYAEASAQRIFGDRLGSPLADVILQALAARGPMTETGIHRLFRGHKLAAEIQGALDHLLELGRVRRKQETTGGRPATLWEVVS